MKLKPHGFRLRSGMLHVVVLQGMGFSLHSYADEGNFKTPNKERNPTGYAVM